MPGRQKATTWVSDRKQGKTGPLTLHCMSVSLFILYSCSTLHIRRCRAMCSRGRISEESSQESDVWIYEGDSQAVMKALVWWRWKEHGTFIEHNLSDGWSQPKWEEGQANCKHQGLRDRVAQACWDSLTSHCSMPSCWPWSCRSSVRAAGFHPCLGPTPLSMPCFPLLTWECLLLAF